MEFFPLIEILLATGPVDLKMIQIAVVDMIYILPPPVSVMLFILSNYCELNGNKYLFFIFCFIFNNSEHTTGNVDFYISHSLLM